MTPEADLPPSAKLFARLVAVQPSPSPWPTIGRLVLEFVAILAAGGVLFAWIGLTH